MYDSIRHLLGSGEGSVSPEATGQLRRSESEPRPAQSHFLRRIIALIKCSGL